MRIIFLVIIVFNLIFSGCAKATVSKPRRDYLLANDHGWIEIEVKHQSIDSISNSDEPIMPLCSFNVYLNNEHFISETIYPHGKEPPYSSDTGFRFPAPVGTLELRLNYSGCSGEETILDSEGNEVQSRKSIENNSLIEVRAEMVTKLYFDGNEVVTKGIVQNEVITLKDLNDAIINIESSLYKDFAP